MCLWNATNKSSEKPSIFLGKQLIEKDSISRIVLSFSKFKEVLRIQYKCITSSLKPRWHKLFSYELCLALTSKE